MATDLNKQLSKKTTIFGLMVWELIGISVALCIIVILCILSLCLTSRNKKSRKAAQIPTVSKEIKAVQVEKVSSSNGNFSGKGIDRKTHNEQIEEGADKIMIHLGSKKAKNENKSSSQDYDLGSSGTIYRHSPSLMTSPSPLSELSYLGWGYWFTLRELNLATNCFSEENVIGEGGYGVVYRGCLVNGTAVAVKRILNNQGQAEKEFRVEVEAIGHVHHKNLVRLLGYCIEGTHRMVVYEYVNNGNLEQWLHGNGGKNGYLTWEARMKIMLGTAKGLAYLHEAIEPKVVHRDIKSSNILIDEDFNAKVSDFGLAKLLDAMQTHVTTRVMGTFGYVAPEYASTGLLSEKSDVYSFGVVLVETITGRNPVDYKRPTKEVNVIDWLRVMVGSRRCEEVVDSNIGGVRPSTRALKRALLVALRCVDPDYQKRPKMGRVVRMLEPEN